MKNKCKKILAFMLAFSLTAQPLMNVLTVEAETTSQEETESRDYDVSKIHYTTGSAQQVEGNEGPISFAFDKNTETYWHSEWEPEWSTSEHENYLWVQFDLEEATVVDAIRYLPRQTVSRNGDITGYRVEGTVDGETWTTLTTGTWASSQEWKIAEFDAIELVSLRLVATTTYADSGGDQFASAAELRVRKAEESTMKKDILLEVGEVMTITDKTGRYAAVADTSSVDTTKATVTLADGSEPLKVASLEQLESGEQYWIVNNRAETLLKGYTYSSTERLALDGSITDATEGDLWTIDIVSKNTDGTVTVNISQNGQYLNIGNAVSSLVDTQTELTLSYDSGNGVQIKQGNYYLNNYQGSGQCVGGYRGSNDVGNWCTLYETDYTNLTFTGVAAGDTTVLVGNVTYNIRVVDEKETKDVTLYVGSTLKFENRVGDFSADGKTIDESVATVDLSYENKANPITSVEEVVSGGRYWISNNRANKLLTSNIYKDNGVDTNRLALDGSITDAAESDLWTIDIVSLNEDNTATVQISQNGQYLNIGNDTTSVGTSADLTLSYGDGGAQIANGNIYLNNHYGWNVSAAGYARPGDAGNWCTLYEGPYTQVTFKGVAQGKTTVIVGNVLYNITVLEAEARTEDVTLYVGSTKTVVNNLGDFVGSDSVTVEDVNSKVKATAIGDYVNEKTEINSIADLVAGRQYWILNKRENKLLTSDMYNEDRLALEGDMTNPSEDALWTIDVVSVDTDDTATVRISKNGQYLNISAGKSSLEDTQTKLTLSYGQDKEFQIKQGAQYLNDHNGNSAGGYASDGDPGNWCFLYEGPHGCTETTFTGVEAGETTVTVGNVTYNITVIEPSFVIDFGLPVEFDFSAEEGYSLTAGTYNTDVANVTVADNKVTYTLNKALQGVDTVTIDTASDVDATINVYPATSVYYEQDFMSRVDDTKWDLTHAATTGLTQQAAQPGADDAYNYGYDRSYDTAENTYVSATASGAKGTFTFTGTGVDIYGNCNAATGLMMVLVREGNSQGKLVEMMTVDTNLNYVDANGNSMWSESVGTIDEIAGVPIVTVDGLAHGTYEVSIIYVAQTDSNATGIVIDGFRVHGTLDDPEDQDLAAYQALYAKDEESYPAYYEMRDAVITGLNVNMSESGSIYAEELSEQIYDSVGSMTGVTLVTGTTGTTNVVADENLKDFLDNSSKNELYLYPGQSLVFKLGAGTVNPQIAMRALTDTAEYQVLVDGAAADESNLTLSADTEMYYSLTMTENTEGTSFTIANTGSGALAITKLKVPGATGTFVALTAEDLVPALLSMGYKENPDAGDDKLPIVNPFADVTADDYFYNAVLWALENNVTAGTGTNTFSPNAACTRGQVVTFLWNAAGRPSVDGTSNPFADVAEEAYYYEAVLWAVKEGITAGTSANTFEPDATCTRAQVAAFLWRVAKRPAVKEASAPFADVAEGAYYHDAILWAVEKGIAYGTSASTFEPDETCTRAQIVTFLYRAR